MLPPPGPTIFCSPLHFHWNINHLPGHLPSTKATKQQKKQWIWGPRTLPLPENQKKIIKKNTKNEFEDLGPPSPPTPKHVSQNIFLFFFFFRVVFRFSFCVFFWFLPPHPKACLPKLVLFMLLVVFWVSKVLDLKRSNPKIYCSNSFWCNVRVLLKTPPQLSTPNPGKY